MNALGKEVPGTALESLKDGIIVQKMGKLTVKSIKNTYILKCRSTVELFPCSVFDGLLFPAANIRD